MALYHWSRSEALKGYASGDIIVMADTLHEAREKAITHIHDWLKENRSWWYASDGTLDLEGDEYDKFLQMLQRDLEDEPAIVETGTIFIRGSA